MYSSFFIGIAMVFIYFISFHFLDKWLIGSKTYQYRKGLVDMYVSGKIRQLAKSSNVNLIEELKIYKKFTSKKDLDDKIEQELQDKVESKKESK